MSAPANKHRDWKEMITLCGEGLFSVGGGGSGNDDGHDGGNNGSETKCDVLDD